MDGIDENDNEFVQLSNFEHFIDMLNVFVARKGMIKSNLILLLEFIKVILKILLLLP